ncbi:MAG TPA: hypothetical protein VGI17_14080 [Solirubrobacterales bacterium]
MTRRGEPADRARKVVLGLIAASFAAAGVALATNEELRRSVVDSAKTLADEIAGDDR